MEKEVREIRQKVYITTVLSKECELILPEDYKKEELVEEVRNQIVLPTEALNKIAREQEFDWAKKMYSGWEEESLEVSDI